MSDAPYYTQPTPGQVLVVIYRGIAEVRETAFVTPNSFANNDANDYVRAHFSGALVNNPFFGVFVVDVEVMWNGYHDADGEYQDTTHIVCKSFELATAEQWNIARHNDHSHARYVLQGNL